MNTYTIKKADERCDWSVAETLSIDNALWVADVGIQSYGQFLWDESGIYVHLWAREKNIRAEGRGPLSMVCEDSCLEFFFQPVEYDARYFSFEINPNGAFLYAFQIDRLNAVRLKLDDYDKSLNAVVEKTEDGWDAKYKIPIKLIQLIFPGYGFKSGMVIRANCFKCGDKTVNPHYYSWNKVEMDYPDFHKHEFFGRMTLE